MTEQSQESSEEQTPFESQLKSGSQRFLAHVLMDALRCGRRTPEDFIRHFPPADIMAGLRALPSLRAKILVGASSMKRKIALKMSPESSGEVLLIALDEGEVDAKTVVDLIDPDDRIRYLKDTALWSFITEGEFWKSTTDKESSDRSKAHIAFMLQRALKDQLVTHQDIVEGISVGKLVELLPRADLGEIIVGALQNSHSKKTFTEEDLLRQTPSEILVKHVPLEHIWESVIQPKVAIAHGYQDSPAEPESAAVPEVTSKEPATGTSQQAPTAFEAAAASGDDAAPVAAAVPIKKKPRLKSPVLSQVIPQEPEADAEVEAALANLKESTAS